jgi:hypothetical protein
MDLHHFLDQLLSDMVAVEVVQEHHLAVVDNQVPLVVAAVGQELRPQVLQIK